jgi:endonuclease YncB( thermonuclease family)
VTPSASGFLEVTRGRRTLALAAFVLSVIAGAVLASLAMGAGAALTVVDGDTVKLFGQSYRLLGYDSPETCEVRERTPARRSGGGAIARADRNRRGAV